MKKTNIGLLLLALAGLSGCIREDRSGCPQGLYLTFAPENPKHDYPVTVQNLTLFFYRDGEAVQIYEYTRADLRASDRAAFVPDLEAGDYQLLAVVNSGIDTNIENRETYPEVYSRLLRDTIDRELTVFYSGQREAAVPEASAAAVEIPVELYKHNNRIELTLHYSEEYVLPENTSIAVYMDGSNGSYHYARRGSGSMGAVSLPWGRTEETSRSTMYLTTMHLWHGSDINIHIEERANTLSTGNAIVLNLTELLKKVAEIQDETGQIIRDPYATDEGLRFYDEFEISVTIGKSFAALEVTVNDWAVIRGGVEV